MRKARIRPRQPWRPGSLRGDDWNCETCGLKPYRHEVGGGSWGTINPAHPNRSRGCARYKNPRARRILGWPL